MSRWNDGQEYYKDLYEPGDDQGKIVWDLGDAAEDKCDILSIYNA